MTGPSERKTIRTVTIAVTVDADGEYTYVVRDSELFAEATTIAFALRYASDLLYELVQVPPRHWTRFFPEYGVSKAAASSASAPPEGSR